MRRAHGAWSLFRGRSPRRLAGRLASPAGELGNVQASWWVACVWRLGAPTRLPSPPPLRLAFPAGELGNVLGWWWVVGVGVPSGPCCLLGLLRAPKSARTYKCLGGVGRALRGPREPTAPPTPPGPAHGRPREPNPMIPARYPVPQRGTPSEAAAGRAAARPPPPAKSTVTQFPSGERQGPQARRRGGQPRCPIQPSKTANLPAPHAPPARTPPASKAAPTTSQRPHSPNANTPSSRRPHRIVA